MGTEALTSMGFYNLNPDQMKELQSPDAGDLLHRDGANIASVIGRMTKDRPEIMERITNYLQAIIPGVTGVERIALGPRETLRFRQEVEGSKHPWKFYATSMSDGTLRALGGLVAVTQLFDRRVPVNLVGIEEPETALHPAAAGVLMDALREGGPGGGSLFWKWYPGPRTAESIFGRLFPRPRSTGDPPAGSEECVMNRFRYFVGTCSVGILLMAFLALPATGQKLPSGEHHRNRERSYDLLHYRAELRFDFEQRGVEGRASILLSPLRRTESITLDAIALEIESVTAGDATARLEFEVLDGKLEVRLGRTAEAGEILTLDIRYKARPESGMYFQPHPENPDLFFVTTYGEGGLHANWLPIYADANDKFTSELLLTVPSPYVAISNGKLVETVEGADGETTYHWLQERPHSNYLIALYVGEYEKGTLAPAFGRIPMAYWVPKGRLAEGAYAFRNTTRMVEFYSQLFSYTYPWVKYDQIAMPDYPIGAMEHTGITGHNASVLRLGTEAPVDFGGPDFSEYFTDWSAEATISHELAHHWFGDNLTCRNLSYIWLNESFASYLMMLWDEEDLGLEQLLFDVELARRHYFRYVESEHIIRPLEYHEFDSPNEIYNTEHTYLKGAAVLHMLRRILGDEPFFGALSHYLHKHEFSNVVSQDLKIAIEEATGENLDWFFDQWVTGGGHPRFEVSYQYLNDRKLIDLKISQVQPLVKGQGIFRLPVTITVATAGKTWQEKHWVEKETENVLIACAEEPLMVSFDGAGDLVAEVLSEKKIEELVYQAEHDALVGRLRAMNQLARRFPTRQETLEVLIETLSNENFWALQAEAAQLLGKVRTAAAEKAAGEALEAADYRIRKAAVLGLTHFGTRTSHALLEKTFRKDPHSDVVGTAIVALARANPAMDAGIFEEQLRRESWYDEIRIACVEAMGELGRPELVQWIRPYANAPNNQTLRAAAFAAWEASAAADEDLHAALLELVPEAPYPLRQRGIEMLGRLAVSAAVPVLEALLERGADPNLSQLAREAIETIRRIEGAAADPS